MINALRIRVAWVIATFFGSGLGPKMPGTFGSIAALPLAWGVWHLSPALAWGSFFILLGIGVWASDVVVEATGVQDNQKIVVDEVLGILLTTAVAPFTWQAYVVALVLFRITDMTKPFPANWLDRNWEGGLGVMADDLAAALWSLAGVALLRYFGWL